MQPTRSQPQSTPPYGHRPPSSRSPRDHQLPPKSDTQRQLVVTQGDPQGIGPELLLRLGDAGLLGAGDRIFADRRVLEQLCDSLGKAWARRGWAAIKPLFAADLPCPLTQVQALSRAVDHIVSVDPSQVALVTAPIDKARCNAEGFAFPGHTEYLADRSGVDEVAMLMVGPRLRVVPATIHIPLRAVPEALTPQRIISAGRLLALTLHRDFGIAAPTIGILGVNPHAGERGLLGSEEQSVITPAIEALRVWATGHGAPFTFAGPLPADTAFPQHASGRYDGLVAMYHDQGLGPFKLLHMHDGVNMTLGLPFVRTSPDHGTARDIAGQGIADPSSMFAATSLARGQASFAL